VFVSLSRLVPGIIDRFPDIKVKMETALKSLTSGNVLPRMISARFPMRVDVAKPDVEMLRKLASMAHVREDDKTFID
jgi:hypothetical protein